MKLAVSFHFGVLWNYVSEVFQTRLRSFAIGVCLMFGLIFQALGPYFLDLAKWMKVYPLVVSIVFVAFSFLSAMYAVETQGHTIKV